MCTIIVPKYETSCITSRARSTVIPLCARSRAYSCRELVEQLAGLGSSTWPHRKVDAEFRAAAPHRGLLTRGWSDRRSARRAAAGRAQDPVVVALRQHDVSAVRAGPLDQLVLEHLRGDHHRALATSIRGSSAVASCGCSTAHRGVDLALRTAQAHPTAGAWPSWRS